ncbi:oxygen-dependent protoporphyrinogen oxidase [Bryocella elongata]|uniref:Coproporphyrinogen III oxidase n=1 Tax=Bryocella elongata TaxID=863522 RepID=A0A1H6C6J6_9BACT|nr:protoporphyrinogen oxidase [Bryocella elongata]SEG68589.1 oxygen-dependent protoporphyrinogen oxidase [Bryocella elongata]
MKRIAILGGGISGLTAAYELEKRRRAGEALDWHLYEASNRLGGILETTRISTPEGEYVLEGGPDGWVSEKPWLRELAIELGLENDILYSKDETRKTWVLVNGQLQAIPDGMRMMVPTDLGALEGSPLFSESAKQAYAREVLISEELKRDAPDADESVASFCTRHFGEDVTRTLAAPLLSGVFGGDVAKLSVRSVMPQFVAMERDYGSLIVALQEKAALRGHRKTQPIFTSLKRGMGSLVDALIAKLPPERLHLQHRAYSLFRVDDRGGSEWTIDMTVGKKRRAEGPFAELIVATSLDAVRELLAPVEAVDMTGLSLGGFLSLTPSEASSAILAAFAWPAELASQFTIPKGFGFLVPPASNASPSEPLALDPGPSLLACTFVDQKFPFRAPSGARVMRAFFGGASADALSRSSDEQVAAAALQQLRAILGPMPDPAHTTVRRWPRSLPQYEVGHLDRMAQLDSFVRRIPGLHLLGNAYRGVGMPDLAREARRIAESLSV